jgi:pyrroline-5-carboxylate reductase
MKLFVIGCGNMGSAIVEAIAEKSIFDEIEVFDNNAEKCARLKGATALPSIEDADINPDTFVLVAVKPQDIDPVLSALKGKMVSGSVLISIAAGVTTDRLTEGTDCHEVVRVMPNTPVLVGKGACGWSATSSIPEAQVGVVRAMLESFGIAVKVNDDDEMNALGTLSGCGPAYVFYFMEALVAGAVKLGMDKDAAKKLAMQTVLGGVMLAMDSDDDLETLRAKVTSKGGVTEQAIAKFDELNFKGMVAEAMQAAYDKTNQL